MAVYKTGDTIVLKLLIMSKIVRLKLFCKDFMIGQLNESNVFGFNNFGQYFCFKKLVIKADKYIARNFTVSTSTKEFLSLEKDKVVSLITRCDFEVILE